MAPNTQITIEIVGNTYRTNTIGELDRNAPKRPSFASGICDIFVPPVCFYF